MSDCEVAVKKAGRCPAFFVVPRERMITRP